MSGGGGHMADMNNRMRQNRSIRSSNKPKFKSNNRDLNFKEVKSEKLIFKKVSDEELAKARNEIRKKVKFERKKQRIIFYLIILLLIVFLTLSLT